MDEEVIIRYFGTHGFHFGKAVAEISRLTFSREQGAFCELHNHFMTSLH
jgi:hypothetical protein